MSPSTNHSCLPAPDAVGQLRRPELHIARSTPGPEHMPDRMSKSNVRSVRVGITWSKVCLHEYFGGAANYSNDLALACPGPEATPIASLMQWWNQSWNSFWRRTEWRSDGVGWLSLKKLWDIGGIWSGYCKDSIWYYGDILGIVWEYLRELWLLGNDMKWWDAVGCI